jgi:hypothetical protein
VTAPLRPQLLLPPLATAPTRPAARTNVIPLRNKRPVYRLITEDGVTLILDGSRLVMQSTDAEYAAQYLARITEGGEP